MSVLVQNLTKRFTQGGPPAVSGVSFEAPGGGITALLGPSGAGKSTVLRLIAGLEASEGGSILIEGSDCANVPVRKRGVGFVFQSYALFDHMTVGENIAFGLSVRKTPKGEIASRVDELLELIQLPELKERRPPQLSGGQRQRVAFARALAIRPKVLLLDEPFGALDTRVRVELREWLRKLHHETRTTTLLVTHDQDEAFEVSDHVVVMFNGKVAQSAPPHRIYDHPASAEVASFIGGANVLNGQRDGEQLLVRPNEVRITARTDETEVPGELSLGKVISLRRVGGSVKLTVQLPSGESVNVQSPKPEIDSLGIGEGDRVLIDLQSARVFVGDYSI
jgi:sulfate transport system ATP-binding protein